ncbi:rna-directed dna polymerase from mobile element jockey-like [Pitangus sulphuratus]|nr:rna-directed dna polymerase from mobile element jockey-like [Pitangus sulphuratus]
MHLGDINTMHHYRLGEELLENCLSEKDLGLLDDRQLHMRQKCVQVAKSANAILDCIRRRLRGNIIALYNYLKGGCNEINLFCQTTSHRARANSLKLHQGRFRLNMRKDAFT